MHSFAVLRENERFAVVGFKLLFLFCFVCLFLSMPYMHYEY